MHIETMKTFCDLVETGSFSRAAALNYISQSAVSQQVKALELRYNCRLIERGNRRNIMPTEDGRILFIEFRGIVDRYQAVETRMKEKTGEIVGTIRVATVYSIGLYELPPYVKEFVRLHPQVRIHVEYSRTDKVYEACRNQTIDFGLIALPLRKPNVEVIPFRDEELVFVCSPGHHLDGFAESERSGVAENNPPRLSLKSLEGEDFVAFEPDIPTRKTIDQILRQHRVAVRTVIEFDNIETIKRTVEVGNGVSILPARAVGNEVRAGLLIARRFTEGNFTRPIGIIHRRSKPLSPAARAFIDLLKEQGEVSVR